MLIQIGLSDITFMILIDNIIVDTNVDFNDVNRINMNDSSRFILFNNMLVTQNVEFKRQGYQQHRFIDEIV